MKLTKSKLRRIIKEELRSLLYEQLPPDEEEIAGTFAQSLATGIRKPGEEEWSSIDRLDEPEVAAMTQVMDQIEDEAHVAQMFDELFTHPKLMKAMRIAIDDEETIETLRTGAMAQLDKLLGHLNNKIDIRSSIERGIDGDLPTWDDFSRLIRKLTERMPIGRKRNDQIANRILRLLLGEIMNRAGRAGETEKGEYGVADMRSGGLGFKDIEEGRKRRRK